MFALPLWCLRLTQRKEEELYFNPLTSQCRVKKPENQETGPGLKEKKNVYFTFNLNAVL